MFAPCLAPEGRARVTHFVLTKVRTDQPKPKRMRASVPVQQRANQLRQSLTPAERILWDRLRDRRLSGLKFRRQHPIGAFIVDFYCPAARLAIEIDGGIHLEQANADASRTQELEAQGYRVIRSTNEQVADDLEGVLTAIQAACQPKTPLLLAGEGQG
jgi:very-short-patch-repair endonuclease